MQPRPITVETINTSRMNLIEAIKILREQNNDVYNLLTEANALLFTMGGAINDD